METQYFTRPAGTLAYTDYGGDGDLVLMLPGMGALRSEYRFLAPVLRDAGYKAVTVDLRGHGDSSVPWDIYDVPSSGGDILALVDHLGGVRRGEGRPAANGAHVIATSFSAGAAVWAATESPAAVRSLVLIGAFVRTAKISPVMSALFWLMMRNPWRVRAWLRYYRTMYPTAKPADFEEYLQRLGENLAEPGRFAAAVALAYSPREPSSERIARVKAPTLVVMGTKDPDFPDPVAEGAFIAEQTGGRLETIEGAGHYPQTEMPEKTAPLILDFLTAGAPAATPR